MLQHRATPRFSTVISSSKVAEKRLTVGPRAVRDELMSGEFLKEVAWASTETQLADCLTKFMADKEMYRMMESGIVKLKEGDPTSSKQKKVTAKESTTHQSVKFSANQAAFVAALEAAEEIFGEEELEECMAEFQYPNLWILEA